MEIIILTLTVICYKTAKCSVVIVPIDTEVRINETTFLNCSTSILSEEVAWYRYHVGDPYRRQDVYYAGVIDRSHRERFYIDGDKENGTYNLVVRRVLDEDAGRYECQDNGGIGEKKSAELVVLDSNGPVCQSNAKPDEIFGPNDCGIEPTALDISCGVKFNGNSPPQLEWSLQQRNESKRFNQGVSCNSTANEATCNLTVNAVQINGSSLVCRTIRSSAHRCSVDDIEVLYAFNNREGHEKTLNDKVNCLANSNLHCKHRWKWFEGEYDVTVVSDSELIAKREGWHRCEADCKFGTKTCSLVAMVIHVTSPSIEGVRQDSKTAVAVLSTVVGFLLLFILLILFLTYPFWRNMFYRHTHIDSELIAIGQMESPMKPIVSEPVPVQETESDDLLELKKHSTSGARPSCNL